ncbi:response regulator [Alginatibacterium sediminis]|uniref:Response regulator n=1 Tax=Alginatibacterium sediminis TaxID=2164068 RepID=A0A420E9X4_9ALTE|nr:response regulator [Alginatibacterium sediminis]RKF17483.1 response regulator [Alginatibacterium sediminis]
MTAKYDYRNKKILIVDDQRAFQVMLKAMLQNFGATDVHFAHTGEAAIRKCVKVPFDILLVDFNLGTGRNGGQLLEELRVKKIIDNKTLFFIISGDNTKGMVLSAIELEPDEFITKPFSQFQLHSRLARAEQKRQELLPVHEAFSNQDYPTIESWCKEYIDNKGRHSNYCRMLMIEAQICQGKLKQAQQLLEALLAHRQTSWVKATLGRVHYLNNKLEEAVKVLTQTTIEYPLLMITYDWLARSYHKQGEVDKALDTIQRGIKLSGMSIERHQLLAELAIESKDHALSRETFATILKLARRSVHRGPQHLSNYVSSLIEEAQHEDDLFRKNRLLQEVSSVIFNARREEGRDESFDFERFEGLSEARVHASKGEMNKAKRLLFNAQKQLLGEPHKTEDNLLPDAFLALSAVGEFEYAMPFANEMDTRKNIDPFAKDSANRVLKDEGFSNKVEHFREQNKLGIQAYEKGLFREAINHFNRALKVAPGNTGAVLNRIQAQLKQLGENRQNLELFNDCKGSIRSIEGLQLNEGHKDRFVLLHKEFENFARPPKAGKK